MTAAGKVSLRLRVSYFTQKDKLSPTVISKIFISSQILTDVGPESGVFFCRAFLSCLPSFPLCKPVQLGKGKTVANLKPLSAFPQMAIS